MKSIIILVLTLAFISNVKIEDFSVEELVNYLKEVKFFDIIEQVNIFLGYDISIDFCKLLAKNNNCDKVVINYMLPPEVQVAPAKGAFPKSYGPSLEDILIHNINNYNILTQNLSQKEFWDIIEELSNY